MWSCATADTAHAQRSHLTVVWLTFAECGSALKVLALVLGNFLNDFHNTFAVPLKYYFCACFRFFKHLFLCSF